MNKFVVFCLYFYYFVKFEFCLVWDCFNVWLFVDYVFKIVYCEGIE